MSVHGLSAENLVQYPENEDQFVSSICLSKNGMAETEKDLKVPRGKSTQSF